MLIGLLLAACNGVPSLVDEQDGYHGELTVSSGFPIPYFFHGSAVQWNEDYAVSVRHIPFLSGVVYTCSTGCDLVFIRHKAKGPLPHWREPVKGEVVTAVGFSPLLFSMKGQGQAIGLRVMLPNSSDPTAYAAHDGPIVQGMSGGPVYGADGAVLGMTIGILYGELPKFGEFASRERLSLYVPYDIVQREWENFSRQRSNVAF
ncbi:serine protease [Pseudomonas fluorescens]|uniref:serine protease n=1 Tax=Pseudomonas fluorescens TaxID=294 RepID=UPI001A9E680E|nr:serine protease [Pseudomonas fluorescens]QTD31470.1 serine protease [Pseudomonas fluorescens]